MVNADASRRYCIALLCLCACFLLSVSAGPALLSRQDESVATLQDRQSHLHHDTNNTFPAGNTTISNSTTSEDKIATARKVLAEAMAQQGRYNRYRFAHPRRNSYKPGQRVPLRKRDSGEPDAPHLNVTVLAASALVAEHDAKAQAANGTLHKTYPPLSYKANDPDASPPSSGSSEKRAIENDWWVPAIQRDGSAPMGSGSYPV
jgi:hypothetical protein